MMYWVMKLYENEMAERMSMTENGFLPEKENEDTGFTDYNDAVDFAATLTAEKGGGYAVLEVKDMFCQTPDDEGICRGFAQPISRLKYDDTGEPILSIGVAGERA